MLRFVIKAQISESKSTGFHQIPIKREVDLKFIPNYEAQGGGGGICMMYLLYSLEYLMSRSIRYVEMERVLNIHLNFISDLEVIIWQRRMIDPDIFRPGNDMPGW